MLNCNTLFNPCNLERDSRVCCSQCWESRTCIACFCNIHWVRGCPCGSSWHRDCEWPNEECTRWTSRLLLRHTHTRGSTAKKFIWKKCINIGCFSRKRTSRHYFAHKIRWRNIRNLVTFLILCTEISQGKTYSWMFLQAGKACTLHLFTENHFVVFLKCFLFGFSKECKLIFTLSQRITDRKNTICAPPSSQL